MAKKRKGKIKISLSKPDNNDVVRLSEHELPAYHHFIDAPDHSFRLFFEAPQSLDETIDPERKRKKFLRKPNGRHPFRIMAEGKALVGENIAMAFAVLLSRMILNQSITNKFKPCEREHLVICNFFRYLASLHEPPIQFSEIRITHLSDWLSQLDPTSVGTYKVGLKKLIYLHPLANELDMSNIRVSYQVAVFFKTVGTHLANFYAASFIGLSGFNVTTPIALQS